MRWPHSRSMRSCSRAGSAAEPETSSRARASAAPTAAFSSAAAATRWYIVGTANNIVPSAASSRVTASGRSGPRGSACSRSERARGCQGRARAHGRAATRARGRPATSTPYLGKRVEIRGDGTAGQHDALRQPGRARRVENQSGDLRIGLRWEHEPAGGGRVDLEALQAASCSGSGSPALQSTSDGALSRLCSSSRPPLPGLTGTAATPARIAPRTAMAVSSRSDASATRSRPQPRRALPLPWRALTRERTPGDADRLPRPWSLERGKSAATRRD